MQIVFGYFLSEGGGINLSAADFSCPLRLHIKKWAMFAQTWEMSKQKEIEQPRNGKIKATERPLQCTDM